MIRTFGLKGTAENFIQSNNATTALPSLPILVPRVRCTCSKPLIIEIPCLRLFENLNAANNVTLGLRFS